MGRCSTIRRCYNPSAPDDLLQSVGYALHPLLRTSETEQVITLHQIQQPSCPQVLCCTMPSCPHTALLFHIVSKKIDVYGNLDLFLCSTSCPRTILTYLRLSPTPYSMHSMRSNAPSGMSAAQADLDFPVFPYRRSLAYEENYLDWSPFARGGCNQQTDAG